MDLIRIGWEFKYRAWEHNHFWTLWFVVQVTTEARTSHRLSVLVLLIFQFLILRWLSGVPPLIYYIFKELYGKDQSPEICRQDNIILSADVIWIHRINYQQIYSRYILYRSGPNVYPKEPCCESGIQCHSVCLTSSFSSLSLSSAKSSIPGE